MHLLLKLISMLPLNVLQSIGVFLGKLTLAVSPKVRRITRENLRAAGYDDAMVREVVINVGRQAMESLWIWYRPAQEVLEHVTIDEKSRHVLQELMDGHAPAVFMTPHIGSFELIPVWIAAAFAKGNERKVAILYRPPHNALLGKVLGTARAVPGMEMCPATIVGVKRIIKNLRAGNIFGVLPDQVPSQGEGIWADFFGLPAYTMTLPVKVAAQFNATRVVAWALRKNNGWTIHVERWETPLSGDLQKDTAAMNRQLEKAIRHAPEQYAWTYNRYKVPAGASARPEVKIKEEQ